jgi:type IV secretory pathway VirJ component
VKKIVRLWPALAGIAVLACAAASAQTRRPLSPDDLSNLPITEMPAAPDTGSVLALFLTGDGGWASLDKGVVGEMRARGIAVVGLNTRPYLSRKKSPADISADLTRISRHYLAAWNRPRLAIVGYSRGADLMPFGLIGMPEDLRDKIVLLGLLGLGTQTGFEFHFEDIIMTVHRAGDQPTLPALAQLKGMKMLCVFGKDEEESGCRDAPPGLITRKVELPGGHHWDNNYKSVGDLVADEIRSSAAAKLPAEH